MDKIFLIEISRGSWDDHVTFVHSVWKTREEAEKKKEEIEEKVKELKSIPRPFFIDSEKDVIVYEGEDELEEKNYHFHNEVSQYFEDIFSKEDVEKYYTWDYLRHEAQEFNSATVVEFELGKVTRPFFDI